MLSRFVRLALAVLLTLMILVFLAQRSTYDFKYHLLNQEPLAPATQAPTAANGDVEGQDTSRVAVDGHEAPAASSENPKPPMADNDAEVTLAIASDWARFAYTQYVTNTNYLCNSVMIFESLHRLGSLADRVLMYPRYMLDDPSIDEGHGRNQKLLLKARDEYGAKLVPIEIQHRDNNEDETWEDSYTKLLAFNQTQYDRVISLDSDALVLQHMDELFLLPPCPVAMPRAYWLLKESPPKKILASHIMLLQPSQIEFSRLLDRIAKANDHEFDMEIINSLYLDSALVFPHRQYALLTAEFRSKSHTIYLGSDKEEWDAREMKAEAKYVHFSDWPVPKPWLQMPRKLREKMQPKCKGKEGTKKDGSDREVWNGLYAQFAEQRAATCDV